ncbi:MAG: 50S ribosomal protein L11 methyltransferase [Pseudomonadales bacterium]|nr:50S ribosomal protein L11 methyltransferase [Pseudomonadales bacterium]
MAWVQLTLQISGKQAEQFEDALLEVGASAVTLVDAGDQPLLEPPPGATPIWDDSRVTGLFDAGIDSDILIVALKNALSLDSLPSYRFEALEDKDWEREWMNNYQPMKFGTRLWVCPSWCAPPQPDAINLLLDPGLAFGTGTHPTTALCLEWLDAMDLDGKRMVDYGCGSGILAVAGALLGCNQVLGIDNDPQALLASNANAERNQVSHLIQVFSPDSFPNTEADVLVANILAGPLIQLAEKICQCIKPGGHIALSGILAEQATAVSEAYAPWITLDPIAQKEDWVRMSGVRIR